MKGIILINFLFYNIKSIKIDIINEKEQSFIPLFDKKEKFQNNDGIKEDKIKEKEDIHNLLYGINRIKDLNKSLTTIKSICNIKIFNDIINKLIKKRKNRNK